MPAISAPLNYDTSARYRSLLRLVFFLLASSLPLILSLSPLLAHSPSSQPISHLTAQPIIPNRAVCHNAGVSKDANGVYHFSWLHVDSATGYIMDAHNCIVDLRGF